MGVAERWLVAAGARQAAGAGCGAPETHVMSPSGEVDTHALAGVEKHSTSAAATKVLGIAMPAWRRFSAA